MRSYLISPLDKAIIFCGAFEAELLVMLMMHHWDHPQKGDEEAANVIVEVAAEVLNRAKSGEQFIEDVPAESMNFVAAVWYAELCQAEGSTDPETPFRRAWLDCVRRALPSCFCDPRDLGDT